MARGAALEQVPDVMAEYPPGCGYGAIATFAARPELGAEWIEVDAALAAAWDELDSVNRKLRTKRVDAIASDILGDAWVPDGSTFVFIHVDGAWQRMDGQHRAAAIKKAAEGDPDAKVLTLVVWGVERRARRVKDTGASRTIADVLTMEHRVPNSSVVGALSNRWTYWVDATRRASQVGGSDDRHLVASARNTHTRQLETYENPAYRARIERAAVFAVWAWGRSRSMRKVTKSAWGIAHLILSEATGWDLTDNTAEFFLSQCVTGERIEQGDPAYEFRTRMETLQSARKTVTEQEALYCLFTAWTAFRGGKKIRQQHLVKPRVGITAMNFPIPK
jgi:hypothetical protein